MSAPSESAIHSYAHAACDCSANENQVCDICQGLSNPWRKHVLPSGPWRVQWYGSGEDRGYHIKEGRETIAFLGADVDGEAVQDIVWAYNVSAAYAVGREEKLRELIDDWQTDITPDHLVKSQCATQLIALIGPKRD